MKNINDILLNPARYFLRFVHLLAEDFFPGISK